MAAVGAPGRVPPRRDSLQSSVSAGSTRGSLRVTATGRLVETAEGSNGQPVEEATLTALFLSGEVSRYAGSEPYPASAEEEAAEDYGADDGLFSFFRDPPCVMPPTEAEDYEAKKAMREQDTGAQGYWKSHATALECWPRVQETRARNLHFNRSIGRGRTRRTSVVRFRVYVNTSVSAIGVRSTPTLADAARTGSVILPGQLVTVKGQSDEDGVSYLKLREPEGYVFEARADAHFFTEATNVETGQWWYKIVCAECVEVRSAPSFSPDARSGWVLSPQEVAVVSLRCRVSGAEWLQLSDGRGWVFAMKPKAPSSDWLQGGVFEECGADFVRGGNLVSFYSSVPPTDDVVQVGSWLYVVQERPVLCLGLRRHGTFLSPGDVVKVDKRCVANGLDLPGQSIHSRLWCRLADGRGWFATVNESGKEQAKERDPGDTTYPAWFSGSQNIDAPKEAWMVGFA